MKKIIFLVIISNYCNAQTNVFKKQKPNCGNIKAINNKNIPMDNTQLNVLGTPLQLASINPITGFFRNGYCNTDANDKGLHVVAAIVTDAFLQYSKAMGNDLTMPYPASNFPGLQAGDVWCLCVLRWKEAYNVGLAPPVILEATNIKALEFVTIDELKSIKE
jgi:uncharacterized protein